MIYMVFMMSMLLIFQSPDTGTGVVAMIFLYYFRNPERYMKRLSADEKTELPKDFYMATNSMKHVLFFCAGLLLSREQAYEISMI